MPVGSEKNQHPFITLAIKYANFRHLTNRRSAVRYHELSYLMAGLIIRRAGKVFQSLGNMFLDILDTRVRRHRQPGLILGVPENARIDRSTPARHHPRIGGFFIIDQVELLSWLVKAA